MRTIALMFIVLPVSLSAMAQQDEGQSNRRVKYAERTEIEFDLREIDGTLTGPEIQVISEALRPEHGPMFELRTNFNDEMVSSVDAIK